MPGVLDVVVAVWRRSDGTGRRGAARRGVCLCRAGAGECCVGCRDEACFAWCGGELVVGVRGVACWSCGVLRWLFLLYVDCASVWLRVVACGCLVSCVLCDLLDLVLRGVVCVECDLCARMCSSVYVLWCLLILSECVC